MQGYSDQEPVRIFQNTRGRDHIALLGKAIKPKRPPIGGGLHRRIRSKSGIRHNGAGISTVVSDGKRSGSSGGTVGNLRPLAMVRKAAQRRNS